MADKIEHEDGNAPRRVDALLTLLMFAFLLFVVFQVANEYILGDGQIPPNNAIVAGLFLAMFLWGILAQVADENSDATGKKFSFLARYISYGKDLRVMGAGLLLGLVLGFLMQASNAFSLAIPFFATATVLATVEQSIWQGIWTVIVAPFVEEKVFAGSLPVQIQSILGDNVLAKPIAWLFTAFFFSALHFVVYSFTAPTPDGATTLMIGAFVFRLMALFLNDMLKSTAPSYGMHVMSNLIQVVR